MCGSKPEHPNSVFTVTTLSVGGVANYTCDPNYIVYSSSTKWTISICVLGENESLPYWTETDNCSGIIELTFCFLFFNFIFPWHFDFCINTFPNTFEFVLTTENITDFISFTLLILLI